MSDPTLQLDKGAISLWHGDCLDVMAELPDDCIDAIVCDPPYGLEFMGKEWDKLLVKAKPRYQKSGKWQDVPDGRAMPQYKAGMEAQKWHYKWAKEALRIAKPGAHLLAFGGTRTSHRLACAIEDAGWQIRDTLMWIYSQGFPKSLDVSKNIDKYLGAEREKIRYKPRPESSGTVAGSSDSRPCHELSREMGYLETYGMEPVTEQAKQWEGWGTSLKPSYEIIILARKKLIGTVAENVLEHGTGGLNIDVCRVGTTVETWPKTRSYAPGQIQPGGKGKTETTGPMPQGRWPANIILDGSEEVVGMFPNVKVPGPYVEQSKSSGNIYGGGKGLNAGDWKLGKTTPHYGDSGSAARFFYTAKTSKSERGKGNIHPTVKPISLMEYLVKLITPPDAIVLDPFMGSGTTGIACIRLGHKFYGIEKDEKYFAIATKRIKKKLKKDKMGFRIKPKANPPIK